MLRSERKRLIVLAVAPALLAMLWAGLAFGAEIRELPPTMHAATPEVRPLPPTMHAATPGVRPLPPTMHAATPEVRPLPPTMRPYVRPLPPTMVAPGIGDPESDPGEGDGSGDASSGPGPWHNPWGAVGTALGIAGGTLPGPSYGYSSHTFVPRNRLPVNEPPRLVVLVNDAEETFPYTLNSRRFELRPGQADERYVAGPLIIGFRGPLGPERNSLPEGVFVVTQGPQGFILRQRLFDATIDNRANMSDFHCLVNGERRDIPAGSVWQTGKQPFIVIAFDQGNGGPPKAMALASHTYQVAFDRQTRLWDLRLVGEPDTAANARQP